MPFNVILVDPRDTRIVYAGSDNGLWRSSDGGATFATVGRDSGLPPASGFDIQINPTTNRTMIFTYGRGAFELSRSSREGHEGTKGMKQIKIQHSCSCRGHRDHRVLRVLLSAIGMSVWSVAVACSQPAPPAVLSEALRAHIKGERFGIVTSIRGLPLGVRDELQTLFSSQSLDIAEPGAEFQVSDVMSKPNLPIRRLVAAGCSIDHCLVYYERGGIAHTWQAALFHWTPSATRFEWGGSAPAGLATIDDVRNAMLSGAIKGPLKFW